MRRGPETHALENGGDDPSGTAIFNRVASSHELQEFLSDSPFRRFLKGSLNSLLKVGRMGDTLKIRAEK